MYMYKKSDRNTGLEAISEATDFSIILVKISTYLVFDQKLLISLSFKFSLCKLVIKSSNFSTEVAEVVGLF